MKNIAIILAGGTGNRMGADTPKQFLHLAGKTVVEHTVEAFHSVDAIDEIAIVMHPDHIDEMQRIVNRNNWPRVKRIIAGGSQRYLSTLAAVKAYDECGECNLIFHDAARPLVSIHIINDVVKALLDHKAVAVAAPLTDTIFQLDDQTNALAAIPPRRLLRSAQTPQAFRLSVIKQAYQLALQDAAFESTDDCGTVLHYLPEIEIHLVDGDPANIKITFKDDIKIAELLMCDV